MGELSGTLTALITPFRDGAVDEGALRELVEAQLEGRIDGLVPCGTTGESVCLSEAEYSRVVRATVEQAKGRVPVVALAACGAALLGTGCISETVAESKVGLDDPERPDRTTVPDDVYDERGERFVYVGPGATEGNRALLESLLDAPQPIGSEVEILAQNLRSHSNRQGHYYVQAEPDYELAELILSGATPGPTRPGLPVEERDTVGAD